jgi:hypothetical protein
MLLPLLDANGLVDWSATALDGSNIRALKCTAGAQKNILISPEIMGLAALAVVLAPKYIWRQMMRRRSPAKHCAESRTGSLKPT